MNNLMTFDEWMLKNLADDVEEAAALLRLTLAEDQDDPQILLTLVQRIVRARGSIDDLGLNLEEKAELASALSRSLANISLPEAA
jgi:DNA-binding phage protein